MRTLAVVLLLAAAPALAQASDAPKAEAPASTPAPAPVAPSESKVSLANRTPPSMWLQAGAGAGAALISVPLSLYLAGWIGTVISNNVYVALIPSLLVMGLLPSLAVTAAVVGIGNYYSPGTYPFWRVWGLTTLANIAALIIGGFANVTVGVFTRVLLFAICEAVVLPLVAVPSARWLAKPPPEGVPPSNRLSTLEPWNPGAATRWFVPAAEVSF